MLPGIGTIGNGQTSNEEFPGPITYTDPGTYTIVLTVTGRDLQESVDTEQVIVSDWECGMPWFDVRDGTYYNTVDVNGVCFMAEDLHFIPEDLSMVAIGEEIDMCAEGMAYYTAGSIETVMLESWHVPTEAEIAAVFGPIDFTNPELPILQDPDPPVLDLYVGGSTGFDATPSSTWTTNYDGCDGKSIACGRVVLWYNDGGEFKRWGWWNTQCVSNSSMGFSSNWGDHYIPLRGVKN
jgi:PKD repeat protein